MEKDPIWNPGKRGSIHSFPIGSFKISNSDAGLPLSRTGLDQWLFSCVH
jgi:hypothetical protein